MRDLLRLLALRARTRGRLVAARDVRIGPGVRAEVAPGARVRLGPGVVLGAGARISALGGAVELARRARLGERAVIVSHAGVRIGEGAHVGDWAAIEGGAPTWDDVERPLRLQPLQATRVIIGAGAVIGPHAVVGATVVPGEVIEPYTVRRGQTL
jgi:acetyltransferase-like isoleucine patch superfamily enzyme